MTWTEPEQCRLCGSTERRDLWFTIVHWKLAEPGMAYEHVPACRDRDACMARVLASKKPWPLVDSRRSVA